MKHLNQIPFYILLLLFLTLSGCATSKPITTSNVVVYNYGGDSGVEIKGDLSPDVTLDIDKIVIDEFKGCVFRITDLRGIKAQNAIWKVQTTIMNKKNDVLNLQYRFTWFDENGIEIDPATSVWLTQQLYGKDSKSVTGIARSSRAVTFKLQVRGIEYRR